MPIFVPPSSLRPDAADAARASAAPMDVLRGRGSGCPSPALGCNRSEYTVAGAGGYLRKGYDTGRWYVKGD